MALEIHKKPPQQESAGQHISALVRSNDFYATTDLPFEVTKETNWDDILSDEVIQKIHDLSLSDCKLSKVPRAVPSMTQLTRLYLTYNNMSGLPTEFAGLINLQILNLGFNAFSEIPAAVFELRKLKVLYLKNNSITSAGVGHNIQNLTSLEELYLGNNPLETFPESVCKLREVRLLSLSSNRIRVVPNTIRDMKNLTVLVMRSNRLQHVPDVIGDLISLESLCFAQNMITKFPFEKDCNVGQSSQEVTELYSNTSRVVCVVCTEEMGDLLQDETSSTAKMVKSVMESRASSSISVIFDGNCQIAQMLFRLIHRGNIITRCSSESSDKFCKTLLDLMDQIIGQRVGPYARH